MRILIRYDEIGLKSRQVRNRFEKKLIENIENKTGEEVLTEYNRIFLECEEESVPDSVLKLRKEPGVASVSPCIVTSSDFDDIYEKVEEIINEYEGEVENFALDARRIGEQDFTSVDMENDIGQKVVDNFGHEVDLEDPDLKIYLEMRHDKCYVFTDKIECVGGLPIGIEGKVLLLLEDRASVVAGVLMMKRGCEVIPVTSEQDSEVLEEPMNLLKSFDPDIKLIQDEKAEEKLKDIAELFECKSIIVGDSEDDLEEGEITKVSDFPVLRPNISMSDEEVLEKYADFQF